MLQGLGNVIVLGLWDIEDYHGVHSGGAISSSRAFRSGKVTVHCRDTEPGLFPQFRLRRGKADAKATSATAGTLLLAFLIDNGKSYSMFHVSV